MTHREGPRQGWRGLVRRLEVWMILASSAACGGSTAIAKGNDGGIDAGWQTGFASALSAKPLYSLGFLNQGPILSMSFASSPAGANCGTLTSAIENGGDFWTVGVVVPSTSLGPYPVMAPAEPVPGASNDAGATVYLEHSNVDAGLDLFVFATAGIVTVSAAPALAGDEEDGGQLTGTMTYVEFPINPVAVGSCQGGDGGEPQVCTCEDLYGNPLSTCDGGPACCAPITSLTVSISPTFDATPCPVLCVRGSDIAPSACNSL